MDASSWQEDSASSQYALPLPLPPLSLSQSLSLSSLSLFFSPSHSLLSLSVTGVCVCVLQIGVGAGVMATRRFSDGTAVRGDAVRLASKALLYATAINVAFGVGLSFGVAKAMDVHSVLRAPPPPSPLILSLLSLLIGMVQ
jgi:hypothetical protein